jgi:hypothetical protein
MLFCAVVLAAIIIAAAEINVLITSNFSFGYIFRMPYVLILHKRFHIKNKRAL